MSVISGFLGNLITNSAVQIPAGSTDSNPFYVGGMTVIGINVPSLFTGTSLAFLVADTQDGYQAYGQAVFTGTCSNNDTITINSTTITFKTSGPTGNQVLIGASATETATNLYNFLIASTDTNLLLCTYAQYTTMIVVTAKIYGTAGNAYTFSKSASNITLTPSGGVLSSGGFIPLYNTSSAISFTVTGGRNYTLTGLTGLNSLSWVALRSGSTEPNTRTLICTLKGL